VPTLRAVLPLRLKTSIEVEPVKAMQPGGFVVFGQITRKYLRH